MKPKAMKRKKIMKELNYQPTRLQAREIKDPFETMDYFFHDFPIHETRENFWELYKGWVIQSSQYANEETIKDMLCFYTQFMEFLDASYLYTKMQTK
ncbi:hypothetical protein AY601_0955 [Pedobacter cryoconitis]|uniref:Uncharacterized protein n=1 Tax=Pedobacter cryoconitis TaxID=188932 RepID=A0A127V921_9SPHI|nr:hypothetical protein [Pedobacter cryoconitis]AMP97892.1 hypothetical protein AY601_0955 [Pedobacter cryoconitis]